MNRCKILIFISLLISAYCYSQKTECLSDQYLDIYKKKDPQLEQKIKDIIFSYSHDEQGNSVESTVADNFSTIMIPVVFNIVHNGEQEGTGRNLSLAKINDQINVMNDVYSGAYGGTQTFIKFCLAKQNAIGVASTGINRFLGAPNYNIDLFNFSDVDNTIKSNFVGGFPSDLFLNIWTAKLSYFNIDRGLNGYSSFPYTLNGEDDVLDGIVLDYRTVGINTTSDPNDINFTNGRTAAHEAGHWLGLFHIFPEDGVTPCTSTSCTLQEDMVCDTDSVPESGFDNIAPGDCLGYKCGGQTISVVNIMDYQNPDRAYCRKKFTAGQKQRMRDIIAYYRPTIYNQGTLTNFILCSPPSSTGGTSGSCGGNPNLPTQKIFAPNIRTYATTRRRFGHRIEVDDKWLVTIDIDADVGTSTNPAPDMPDYLLIYKRVGCANVLFQTFEIPLTLWDIGDYGLILKGNEIFISSYRNDTVYIFKYNETNNSWSLSQQIQNTSTNDVGTSTYVIDNFLFILEKNLSGINTFKVYYKNLSGIYAFHQNITVPGFSLPSYGKYMQSGNFKKVVVNFNSSTYVGSYDPLEILVSKDIVSGTGFVMFELSSNNLWTLTNTIQPTGLVSSESISDIEVSKDFIYILTTAETGPSGSQADILYLYTYGIAPNSNNPFTTNYTKQTLVSQTNTLYTDIKLKVYNDQFLFFDNRKYFPMQLYYNLNSGTTSLPNWQLKSSHISCQNPGGDDDDFEVVGNLLFYGYRSGISINSMSDILTRANFSPLFISNSDFYNKKICVIPDNYSTLAETITIGESCQIEFSNVKKEFLATEVIVLKSGTTIYNGSDIILKIIDSYNSCNSIIASRIQNSESGFVGLEEDNVEKKVTHEEDVIISPNPTHGFTTIKKLNKTLLLKLELYSLNNPSRLLISEVNLSEDKIFEIDLSNFDNGIYILKITLDDNTVIYKKLIKV
jgi:hypothetical protein